jgi:hypothetical protein
MVSVIRLALKDIARNHVSYAAALSTAAYFREKIGNVDLMPKGCNGKSTDELVKLMLARSGEERTRWELDDAEIKKHIERLMHTIEDSLLKDTDEWKALIPGRVILKSFCAKTPLQYDAFRTAFINAAERVPTNPFDDIVQIFEHFDHATDIAR